jgi:hypothetical protein
MHTGQNLQEIFPKLNMADTKESSGAGENIQFNHEFVEEKITARVKVSFKPKQAIYNNQRVETQIYEHVLENLHQYTPHLPKWYGTLTTPFDQKSSKVDLSNWDKSNWDFDEATALVFEYIDRCTHFLTDPKLVFQVLYTVTCFDRVGLRHGDLHYENILVKELPEEMEFSYRITPDQVVSFNSKYLVKVIDYDRATIYHKNVERNGYLDKLISAGDNHGCYNGYNPGADAFKFLAPLSIDYPDSTIAKWIRLVRPRLYNIAEQIDDITNEMQLLPSFIRAIDFVNDLEELLLSMPDFFPEMKCTQGSAKYSLPPKTAVQPIGPHPVRPVTNSVVIRPDYRYVCMELDLLGYNWYYHTNKLYDDCGLVGQEVMEACAWLTNPIKIWEPSANVKVVVEQIRGKFKPLLELPTKMIALLEGRMWTEPPIALIEGKRLTKLPEEKTCNIV